jgi:ADP-ribose pyrophosphatase YjhB (NUDIX family)
MKKSKMPQPASSAIIERDGRYLLVLRSNPPAAAMYAFPGGRGEPGETPAETALRELREDSPGSPSFFLSVFKVKADAAAIAVASDDAAAVGWYTAEEIETLPAPDSVRECIRRLETERTGQTA